MRQLPPDVVATQLPVSPSLSAQFTTIPLLSFIIIIITILEAPQIHGGAAVDRSPPTPPNNTRQQGPCDPNHSPAQCTPHGTHPSTTLCSVGCCCPRQCWPPLPLAPCRQLCVCVCVCVGCVQIKNEEKHAYHIVFLHAMASLLYFKGVLRWQ